MGHSLRIRFGIQSTRRMLAAAAIAGCTPAADAPDEVVLLTTHTVEDTGLLDALTAAFARDHPEIRLRVVVAGSGEALALAGRGDGDVVLSHAPEDEARFVAEGHGVERTPIMRNAFVLYGPAADPAAVAGAADVVDAFGRIARARARFISRGDDSGTHKRERSVWRAAGIEPAGAWYREAGVGQGDALRLASERDAYMLADAATYAVLREALSLVPLFQGDPRLENVYAVIRVVDAPHPAAARVLAAWLGGPEAAAAMRSLGVDFEGRALFEPIGPDAAAERVVPADSQAAAPVNR